VGRARAAGYSGPRPPPLEQPLSRGLQLPGLDSNQDKENQKTISPQHKSLSPNDSDDPQPRFARRFAQTSSLPPIDDPLVTPLADPGLARVCGAWAVLPAPIRHAIFALVDSATGAR
jgi:hypothetical protein